MAPRELNSPSFLAQLWALVLDIQILAAKPAPPLLHLGLMRLRLREQNLVGVG
jgi:hypothetical protein